MRATPDITQALAVLTAGDPEALERLAERDERQARVVECRYFAGMSVEETGTALGITPATVKRDRTLAKAWLNRELEG